MDALNLFELEQVAKEILPQAAYDYYRSGAWDEITLRENREAFERILVHYRVCIDVSRRDLSTVRAAGSAGTIMVLSSLSNTRVEDVVKAASGPVWFQLYINKDREFT